MFATAIAIVLVIWTIAMVMAHLLDELLWWATPAKGKVIVKHIQWRIAVVFAHISVWEYNNFNRIARRHPNALTAWIRSEAETEMRKQIAIAEDRLEKLSLLLNGIQE